METKKVKPLLQVWGSASSETPGHVLGYARTEKGLRRMLTIYGREFSCVFYKTLQANGEYAY